MTIKMQLRRMDSYARWAQNDKLEHQRFCNFVAWIPTPGGFRMTSWSTKDFATSSHGFLHPVGSEWRGGAPKILQLRRMDSYARWVQNDKLGEFKTRGNYTCIEDKSDLGFKKGE